MDVFNFPKQWILACLTLGIFTHFVLSGKSKTSRVSDLPPFLTPTIIFLIVLIWISAIVTDTTLARAIFGYPGRANGVLTYTCIFVLVWVGSRMSLPENFNRKLKSRLIFVIGLFSFYCLIQYLDFDPVPWNNPYNRIIGTFGNPNFSGAFLGLCAASILALAFLTSRSNRWSYLIFATFLLFLGFSTQSIQSWGIFGIGVLLYAVAYLSRRLSKNKFMALGSVITGLGIFIFLSFLGIGPLGDQLYQYTLRLRFEYWRVGLETVQKFPLFGIGPDSYVEGFRLFKGEEFVKTYSQSVTADSAHNVLINFAANLGIPAFMLFAYIIYLVTKNALKIIFSPIMQSETSMLVAYLWFLLLVQSLFSLEQIGLNVFQWWCGAILLNNQFINPLKSSPEFRKNINRESGTFLKELKTEFTILLILLAMISSWSFVRQELALQRLMSIPSGTKLSNIDIAERMSSFNFFSELEVRRAIFISDFLLRIEKFDEAKTLLDRVLNQDPQAYEALEQLARLARFKSDPASEIMYRKKIEVVDPFNYSNYLSLAQVYETTMKKSLVTKYASKVLELAKEPEIQQQARSLISAQKT